MAIARIGRAVFKMTARRRAALKKAQAASAKARKKSIKKVGGMKLKRVSKGTKLDGQRRISSKNFESGKLKGQRRATYKDRLASSRAKYKKTSLKNKAKMGGIGLVTPTGVFRRKYVDLTTTENVVRNVRRAVIVTGAAAGGILANDARLRRKYRPR